MTVLYLKALQASQLHQNVKPPDSLSQALFGGILEAELVAWYRWPMSQFVCSKVQR